MDDENSSADGGKEGESLLMGEGRSSDTLSRAFSAGGVEAENCITEQRNSDTRDSSQVEEGAGESLHSGEGRSSGPFTLAFSAVGKVVNFRNSGGRASDEVSKDLSAGGG